MDYMVRQSSELRSESMANNTSFAMIWGKKTKNKKQRAKEQRARDQEVGKS